MAPLRPLGSRDRFYPLWLAAALVVAVLSVPGQANADALADCGQMVRDTGAPAYRGNAPDHVALCRIGYVLSFNSDTKVPDWVLEDLGAERLTGSADRGSDPFAPDPDLPAGKRSELRDYANSGFDRGHMAPAGDMKWRDDAMTQSFFLSNMAPQVGLGMNRGIWARLEDTVRTWAKERGRVVVVSGPIFGQKQQAIGDDKVGVPEAFYKIVFDPARHRLIAFVMPNQNLTGHQIPEFIATVKEIEDRTGLDFLSGLTPRDKQQLELVKSPMWRAVSQ